ncbi:MAG: hypothetical protein ACI9WS_002283 [Paraglaciecola psychrophila]|jgi:hypothetical protein
MRRFVRHPTDIPIDVMVSSITPQHESDCAMTSLSQGGLSCDVDRPVKMGCKVSIGISSVSPPYQGVGEIVWCRPKADHFEVGVNFTDAEEAFRSRMVQQVCQIEHYKNAVFEKEGRVLGGEQAAQEWIEKYARGYAEN